ncbi:neurturin [Astyanax mexicanus]|uniref:neurturin n=1 Tax=Astyanax mexicanus TaxID=7994 RepID=UPI0020CB4C25|nr:neurturin [Astyanax mexicanus]
MKLWKGAILALILISTALSLLLTKTMLPAGATDPRASASSTRFSSATPPLGPPPSPSFSPEATGLRRVARSADSVGSLLSQFSYLFQSFTEGELQRVIRMLVNRQSKRSSKVVASSRGRRTKRARMGPNQCKLHKKQLRVSDLGLGYDSNETVVFQYCSGKCTSRRGTYDIVMDHLRLNKSSGQKRKASNVEGARDREPYSPCCRPTKYEGNLVFFGNNGKFGIVPNVSARECGCV